MATPIPKTLLVLAACGLFPSACAKKTDATVANFTAAMSQYLEKRGDLCLGKNVWPIDVTRAEAESGARNAVQMPVLESLGLVSASDATADIETEEGTTRALVKRYQLTAAGKRYYLTRESKTGEKATESDLCAAKLSLDKIVGWQLGPGERPEAVVTYTYRVDAPEWAKTSEARRVFPAVARVIDGEGTAQMKEGFTLTERGFVAKELATDPTLLAQKSAR